MHIPGAANLDKRRARLAEVQHCHEIDLVESLGRATEHLRVVVAAVRVAAIVGVVVGACRGTRLELGDGRGSDESNESEDGDDRELHVE